MNDLKKQLELLKHYTFTLEVQNKARQNERVSLLRELQYCHEQLKKGSFHQCISCQQYKRQIQMLQSRQFQNKLQTKTTGDQSLVQSFGRDILEKSLTDLRQQNLMLQQAVQQQEQIINKLTSQLQQRDRSSPQYINQNNSSYPVMKNEAQGYKIELEATKRQLNATTAKYEDLLRKMNLMSPSQKKINAQILKMESKMKELEMNKVIIQEEVRKFKNELFSKENQIIKLRRQLSKSTSEQRSSRIKSSRNSIEQDYQRIYEENKNLKYQLSCEQQTTVQQNEDMARYAEQLSRFKRQIHNRDMQIKNQTDQLQRLHSYIETYEQKIHEIQQEVQQNIQLQKAPGTERQQMEIATLKQQNNYLFNQNQRLKESNEILYKKMEIQQHNNIQLKEKCQDYQLKLVRFQNNYGNQQNSYSQQNFEYNSEGVPTTKLQEHGQLKNLMLQLKQELIQSKQHTKRQHQQINNLSMNNAHIYRFLSQPKFSILESSQNFAKMPAYVIPQPSYTPRNDSALSFRGPYPINKSDQNRQSWVKMQKKIQQLRKQNNDLKSVLITRKRLHTRC